MEDAKIRDALRTRNSEQIRTRSANHDILADQKLVAGQRDGLAIKRGIKINRISIVRENDRLPQRTGPAVIGVGNDDDVSMRGDCDSENQCHGSHGGSDVEYDSHFHSTSANHERIVMHQKLIPSLAIYSFVLIRGFLDMLGCCVI